MFYAAISLAVLGGIFGVILAVASKKFSVETDPRIDAVLEVLPGANCGSCGFPGCSGYAEAVVLGKAAVDACPVGKQGCAEKIADILGIECNITTTERKVAQLMCNGNKENALLMYNYSGLQDCHAAAALYNGPKACSYGCLGLGSCVKACPFGAITMSPNQLPVIDYAVCTGCNVCVENCPQHVLKLVGANQLVHVRCNNKDTGKAAKEVCKVACISCKLCEKNCPTGAIQVVSSGQGSLAVIDYEKCTNCGICVTKCPTKAIEKIEPISSEVCTPTDNKDKMAGCAHCGLCK